MVVEEEEEEEEEKKKKKKKKKEEEEEEEEKRKKEKKPVVYDDEIGNDEDDYTGLDLVGFEHHAYDRVDIDGESERNKFNENLKLDSPNKKRKTLEDNVDIEVLYQKHVLEK
jgi:outer membrane biosynthesis protein TonB